uniref:Nucleolar/coiled-body phosphoprotein n=1 Tax=Salix viminalis TaxID=40686 RepID=A0A6N2LXA1_SALVM
MGDSLFEGLPPPSHQQQNQEAEASNASKTTKREPSTVPAPPKPALKSALKRPKPVEAKPRPRRVWFLGFQIVKDSIRVSPFHTSCLADGAAEKVAASGKRLRFKTTTDASETQVIEAMKKIASHIKTPTKFSKASKLAIQLIQAGSVKPGTSDHFFAILEAAMSSTTSCTDPSVRADYHALFSAAQDAAECLNKKQKNQLATWTVRAVVANDLFTDDSFVVCTLLLSVFPFKTSESRLQNPSSCVTFSKTAGQVRDAIADLPVATKDDDMEEAASLNDKAMTSDENSEREETHSGAEAEENKGESDPFGLDALIPSTVKKDEKGKGKKDTPDKARKGEEEESKRFLKDQRVALITCLEIAARRYKTPWCQTVIDILVKHAVDHVGRFTSCQRDAIHKLWASIREQLTRRKQGKSVNGKLDVNGFEWLQQKYAGEKISIRHSVGGSGDRRASQWLG